MSVLVALGAGCAPDLGPCDTPASVEVAYDTATGLPAYEGQAIMIASCGAGAFCHADDIPLANRFGVAEGLTFDVHLAAGDGVVDEAAVVRLRRARFRVVQEASEILHTIDLGEMPPTDGPSAEVLASSPMYVRRDETDALVSVPAVSTAEGREVLRNWLACGAPVVERPLPRADGLRAVVVPGLPLEPLEPTWASLYEDLLRGRGCATSLCHGGSMAGFRVTDEASTYDAVVGALASGEDCEGNGTLVVAGEPDTSLFLAKLSPDVPCGDPMPLGGIALRDEDLDAIRTWIADGAPR